MKFQMQWSDIPSLSALRALEVTIRNQSFSKAAWEPNVTHAVIAQHARTLQAEFSQSLVLRQGRGRCRDRVRSAIGSSLE